MHHRQTDEVPGVLPVAPAEIDLGDGWGGRGEVPVPPVAPAETDFLGEGRRRGELRRPEGVGLVLASSTTPPATLLPLVLVLVRCRAMLIMFCGG